MITDFRGEYRWLSNFEPSPIQKYSVQDRRIIIYPTVEHAFQCYKTEDTIERDWVLSSKTPAIARKRGQKVTLNENWDRIRYTVMYTLVTEKFKQNLELKDRLVATEDIYLIEGNTWGDTHWGVCNGRGKNMLGHILMNVRRHMIKEIKNAQ